MDKWKQAFLNKLGKAQAEWVRAFEDALDNHFAPVYKEYKSFLETNGFKLSIPLREKGRRSFKFELAENAYLLMIFCSASVGEFELECESFVPGQQPTVSRAIARAAELDEKWARQHVQSALDAFVNLLTGQPAQPVEELVAV